MSNIANILDSKPRERSIGIGLDDKYLEEMAKTLSAILVDTYQLTIKSHVYHWNVVGPFFKPLHELTEEHYNDLFQATDIIAERIRSLGHLAPNTIAEVNNFAPNAKDISKLSAAEIVEDLISTHEEAVRNMREAVSVAGENGDSVTEDMLTERMSFHEKALWMLRSIITE